MALARMNAVVQALHHDAVPTWFKPPDESGAANLFRQYLDDPGVHLFLAETEEGEPLGYVMARVLDPPATPLTYGATVVEVDQIAVTPGRRREGVGRALVDAVKQLSDDVGADRLHLTVWDFNEGAQQFFAANGFRTVMRRMLAEPNPAGTSDQSS